ncbi:hypothetical protein Gohar_009108 [Gossypium harknessii]|uniref:Uncharacterized protein n=1 Tax=Gossypium harknessii TaxID=34285 RepID=A0A7J9GLS1_9ROSI|nr:hypothetical protein [Gossypium harknessii]
MIGSSSNLVISRLLELFVIVIGANLSLEADALTKMTFENDDDLRMFDVPPMKIQIVLKEDRVKGILAPVTSM